MPERPRDRLRRLMIAWMRNGEGWPGGCELVEGSINLVVREEDIGDGERFYCAEGTAAYRFGGGEVDGRQTEPNEAIICYRAMLEGTELYDGQAFVISQESMQGVLSAAGALGWAVKVGP